MEFVGRTFEKQFKGPGAVNSYDESSGLFKVLYQDGSTEELELSEVSSLMTGGISFDDEHSGSDGIPKRPKYHGRLHAQNSATEDGESSDVNREGFLKNPALMECENLSAMEGSANGLGLNNGTNGFVDDAGDSSMQVERKERFFDPNLDLDGERRDIGETHKEVDAGFEKDRIEASDNGTVTHMMDTCRSPEKQSAFKTENVLCRRSRRLATSLSAQNQVSIEEMAVADREVLQSSVLNSVEELIASDHKESQDCDNGGGGPAKLQLPPSSIKLNLDGMPIIDLFSIYAFLRSFSTILFLSPFEFEVFISSLKSNAPNHLIDSIHVSLLQTLRKHLELLSGENTPSASNCLRSLNWELLDLITWPSFLVGYFLMHGCALNPGFDIHKLKNLCQNDYYKQPDRVKIEILRYLCDDVIQAESIISEINKRAMLIESNVDGERNAKFELSSRRRNIDVSGNSYLGEEVDEDGNIDECSLCKMDGSLICCDGCPAAYHLKCVGIASSDLPEGDWYCHECLIDKKNPQAKLGKSIRGAELLGIDPHGRRYYSSCGYLLVLDPCGDEPTYHWYCPNDVSLVIHVLKTLQSHYNEIMQGIAREWSICTASVGSKINMHTQNEDNCIDLKGQMSVTGTTNVFMKMEIPSSPGEALQLIHADTLQDSGADGRAILNTPNGSCTSALDANRGGEIQSIDCNNKLNLIEHLETGYLNFYSFALRASSVMEELATRKSSDKAVLMPGKKTVAGASLVDLLIMAETVSVT